MTMLKGTTTYSSCRLHDFRRIANLVRSILRPTASSCFSTFFVTSINLSRPPIKSWMPGCVRFRHQRWHLLDCRLAERGDVFFDLRLEFVVRRHGEARHDQQEQQGSNQGHGISLNEKTGRRTNRHSSRRLEVADVRQNTIIQTRNRQKLAFLFDRVASRCEIFLVIRSIKCQIRIHRKFSKILSQKVERSKTTNY